MSEEKEGKSGETSGEEKAAEGGGEPIGTLSCGFQEVPAGAVMVLGGKVQETRFALADGDPGLTVGAVFDLTLVGVLWGFNSSRRFSPRL